MFTMFNRMCWNSRGWRFPTKASADGGYPSKMGFGHEEWNFQIEDVVDGFVYGYLYYRPTRERIKQANGHFRIGFWSIHPKTRQRFLVGIYEDATVPTEDDYKKVDRVFTKRGVYKRRAQELCTAVASISSERACREVTDAVRKRGLTFKCPIEGVRHLAEYIPVDEVVKSRTLGLRFTKPTFVLESDLESDLISTPHRSALQSIARTGFPPSSGVAEDAYYRESPQYLLHIIRRHNKLSNQFAVWLRESGFSNVFQEQDYVDVVFEKSGRLYRAELKACYGVGSTKAIREALGQLLEYNYYPGRSSVDCWVIVLDEKATTDDTAYVCKLKKELKLPLCLGWREGEDFVFAEGLRL